MITHPLLPLFYSNDKKVKSRQIISLSADSVHTNKQANKQAEFKVALLLHFYNDPVKYVKVFCYRVSDTYQEHMP